VRDAKRRPPVTHTVDYDDIVTAVSSLELVPLVLASSSNPPGSKRLVKVGDRYLIYAPAGNLIAEYGSLREAVCQYNLTQEA
jgi:hypothetical protein